MEFVDPFPEQFEVTLHGLKHPIADPLSRLKDAQEQMLRADRITAQPQGLLPGQEEGPLTARGRSLKHRFPPTGILQRKSGPVLSPLYYNLEPGSGGSTRTGLPVRGSSEFRQWVATDC